MINLVIRFRTTIPAEAGISLSPSPFCHSSESWNLHNIRQATFVIPAKAGTSRTIYEATLVIPGKLVRHAPFMKQPWSFQESWYVTHHL
jgi:hypothetical protein